MPDRRSLPIAIGVGLVVGSLLGAGPAVAGDASEGDGWGWSWSATARAGAAFQSGDYGEDTRTDILRVPVGLALGLGPFALEATVPWIRVRGDGGVLGGEVPVPTGAGGRARERETHDGIGDVVLSASYVFAPDSEETRFLPVVALTGKVKLPTADEDIGLGTGKTDYTAQIEVSKTFWRITPFLTFGRRFLGDPSGLDLDDAFFTSTGFGLRLPHGLAGGLVYDWRQASSDAAGDSHELMPYATLELGRHLALESYAVVGLSRSAADYGVGLQLSVRIGSAGDERR